MIKLGQINDGFAIFDYDNATIMNFQLFGQKILITFKKNSDRNYDGRINSIIDLGTISEKFNGELNTLYNSLLDELSKINFKLNDEYPLKYDGCGCQTLFQPTCDENLEGSILGLKKSNDKYQFVGYSSLNDKGKSSIVFDSDLEQINIYSAYKEFILMVMQLPLIRYDFIAKDFDEYINFRDCYYSKHIRKANSHIDGLLIRLKYDKDNQSIFNELLTILESECEFLNELYQQQFEYQAMKNQETISNLNKSHALQYVMEK